jgi:4-amino-4-deoxy-L-arabinose transferase-like glycosyltransferase
MSRREAVLSAMLVFVVALAARLLAASTVVFPKPEDTAYYVDVAKSLVSGHGLITDALWSFQTPPLTVPREAFEVWLPLPTFLAAIPMALLGATFSAAQASSVLIGAFVAVLAWRLGADIALVRGLPIGRARTLAVGSGLTAAVSLPLLLHSTLPDSTMLFAFLSLAACLLMTRIRARREQLGRPRDPFLIALGLVLGLAALTRNEAVWLALVWAILAWRTPMTSRRDRLILIGAPAIVAIAIFVPWAIRDWVAFGNPLPGQALANAISVQGTDVFAWADPPTLSRYLAQGPTRLLEARVVGAEHNLFDVLLLPGAPLSFIGLIALPWFARLIPLRPLVLVTVLTFLGTSLVFPVATTWGTFLHAAAATHVLLIVSALLALDAIVAFAHRRRGWTRPVAWLAPTLTIAGALLFSIQLFPSFGAGSRATARQFEALDRQMTAAGLPLADIGPVITDYPIWLSYTTDAKGLALPVEPPSSILDLARHFPGTKTLILQGGNALWPAVIDRRAPLSQCFEEIDIGTPSEPADAEALAGTRVFRIVCP